MSYFLVTLLIVFLIIKFDLLSNSKGKKEWYFILYIIVALLAGLRYRIGTDTITYESFFNNYHTIGHLTKNDFDTDVLWVFFCSLIKTFGKNWFWIQIIHALFVNAVIFWFIKKYSNYWYIAILIYFLGDYFVLNCEQMRQTIASCILLLSIPNLLDKKYLKFYLLYTIACLFHSSAIVFFILPFVLNLRIDKVSTYFSIVIVMCIGLWMQINFYKLSSLTTNLLMLSSKLDLYATSKFLETVNRSVLNYIFMFGLVIMTFGIAYVLKKVFSTRSVLEPFFILYLLLFILFQIVPLGYRYVYYVSIFLSIFLSELLGTSFQRFKKTHAFLPLSLVIFCIYFAYWAIPCYNNLFTKIETDKRTHYYSRFYPYSSILTKKEDNARESLFKFYNK